MVVDRGMAVANHRHEDVGLREYLLDGRCRIGRRGIVAAESFGLRAYDALRGGNIVGSAGRGGEADQEGGQQGEGAHEGLCGWWLVPHGNASKVIPAGKRVQNIGRVWRPTRNSEIHGVAKAWRPVLRSSVLWTLSL